MNGSVAAGDVALRLVAIDAELASVAKSGAGAFATRYGARVEDLAHVESFAILPNLAHMARIPRSAPFGAYLAVDVARALVVGTCAFVTGPVGRAVEIAYGTLPGEEGRGVARSMARALVEIARASGEVDLVFAHTLLEPNKSSRVLTRIGFADRGRIEHQEDGAIRLWELPIRA